MSTEQDPISRTPDQGYSNFEEFRLRYFDKPLTEGQLKWYEKILETIESGERIIWIAPPGGRNS